MLLLTLLQILVRLGLFAQRAVCQFRHVDHELALRPGIEPRISPSGRDPGSVSPLTLPEGLFLGFDVFSFWSNDPIGLLIAREMGVDKRKRMGKV